MPIQTVQSSNTFNQFRAITNLIIANVNSQLDGTANLILSSANSATINVTTLTVYGDAAIQGGDITTNSTTFTLANTTATSVRIGGGATDLMLGATTGTATIRNASTVLVGDLAVNGGDITTSATTFNVANATATTLSVGGAATSVLIGAATGIATIRNATVTLDGDLNVNGGDIGTSATTFNVANTTATSVRLGGAATDLTLGATTGVATIRNASTILVGDLSVNGGDIGTNQTTFTLANTTATTLEIGGAATTLNLGATTGNTSIRSANTVLSGELFVNGGDIFTTATTFNLANTTATALSVGGAATSVLIGASTGTATIRNATVTLDGDLNVNGGDIATNQTTFTVANTTATSVRLGGAATDLMLGATTGTLTIRNASTVLVGDLDVNGGDINTNQTTFNVANSTATTLNIGGAATALNLGAATGNTTIRNAGTVISGDLFVSGGDIVGTTASLNLANTVTTTLEIGGAATTLNLGAATGNTTVRNNFKVLDNGSTLTSGRLVLVGNSSGGFINQNDNSNIFIQLQGSERIRIEYTSGDVRLNTGTGSLVVAGPSITTNATSFSIANATSTTLNIGGAATSINMGAANSGTFTINNNKAVINSTGALRVPVGNTIQRGTASQGEVRYNTQLSAYEGYDGTNWSSLGGVKSVDGLTYIIAETSPGASDDTLHFYTANGATSFEVAQMDATKFAILQTTASANSTTGALTVAGGVGIAGNLNVAGTQTITGNTTYTANVAVNGGGITTTANTFTLANTTATTLELGGAANVNIGSTSGNTTIRSANAIITGNTIIGGNLTVNGSTTIINSTTLSVDDKNIIIADGAADNAAANGAGITIAGSNANVVYLSASDSFDINKSIITPGDIAVNGGDITTSATTFTLANTTATSVRVGGAATDLMLGATTGTATIRNATVTLDGDLNVNGGDIGTNQTTFTVANTTATTLNIGGAATDLMLGATTGNTNIRSSNTVLAGDLYVNAGDIFSTSTTFTLANNTATTLSVGGAATSVLIGAATGTATIRNASVVLDGDLTVSGGDIVGTATLNLANTTTTTLNLGGAASTLNVGANNSTFNLRSSTLNLGSIINTGYGTTTGAAAIEIGSMRSGDGTSFIDFHSTTGTDFEARIIRNSGANGDFTISQTGNGNLTFTTGGTGRATYDANGLFILGSGQTPKAQFHMYSPVAGQLTANLTDAGSRTDMLRLSSNSSSANAGGVLVFSSNQGDTANSVGFAAIKGMLVDGSNNTTGGISFSTRNANTDVALTERVRIERNGNLTVINDIEVQGGDITTPATTFTLANTTATTLELGGSANVNIGSTAGNTVIRSANTVLTGDLFVNGGDITSTQTTFTVANTTATTLNIGGAATSVNIGAATGNTTINNAGTVISGDLFVSGGDIVGTTASLNLANATSTTLNIGGAATSVNIGANTGTLTVRNATVTLDGDLAVNGGDITSNQTTFTVANTTATTLSLGGAATSVLIGATTGNTIIRNNLQITGASVTSTDGIYTANVAVNGGGITTTNTIFTLANTNATSVSVGGAATSVLIGAATGTTTIRNSTVTLDGDLNVNGGDIGTNQTTFTVANTTATSVRVGGAATDLMLGATTGNTTIRNSLKIVDNGSTLTSGRLVLVGNSSGGFINQNDNSNIFIQQLGVERIRIEYTSGDVRLNTGTGSLVVAGPSITTNATSFSIANTTATSVSVGGAATDLMLGATTGTATIRNASTVLVGDLAVNGGDITTSAATFTIANTTATTLWLGAGATSNVLIGNSSGNTFIRSSNTIVNGNFTANGTITETANGQQWAVASQYDIGMNPNQIPLNQYLGSMAFQSSDGISVGIASLTGDLAVNGSNITTTNTTFTVANTTATTLSVGGAATSVLIGATTGNTVIRSSNTVLSGELFVNGGDIFSTSSTFTLANNTATSVRVGGAATDVMIGSASGGVTTIRSGTLIAGAQLETGLGVSTGTASIELGTYRTGDGSAFIDFHSAAGTDRDARIIKNAGSNGDFVITQSGTGNLILQTGTTATTRLTIDSTGAATFAGNTAINGGGITTTNTIFTIANTTATSVSVGGAATSVLIGAATGTTLIRNNLSIGNTSPVAKFQINTQDGFRFDASGSNTTMRFGSASTGEATGELRFERALGAIVISSGISGNTLTDVARFTASGDFGVGNAPSGLYKLEVTGSIGASANVAVNGGGINTTNTIFTLANTTATSVSVGGAATSVLIGAATGTATIRNATVTLDGDLNVNGGDIATNQTTFNVANTTATSVSVGGAATSVLIGATTGTATIRNANVVVTGTLTSRYATKVANTDTATTLTPDVSANNQYSYTALATGLTINAPTGTPLDGERLTFRIKDNGTSRSLTWNAIYRIVGTVLPTATVASKINYVGCIYNSADTKWDVIAVAREA